MSDRSRQIYDPNLGPGPVPIYVPSAVTYTGFDPVAGRLLARKYTALWRLQQHKAHRENTVSWWAYPKSLPKSSDGDQQRKRPEVNGKLLLGKSFRKFEVGCTSKGLGIVY